MVTDPISIAGLIANDEDAVLAFGGADNCVVVDWRDGAREIFATLNQFHPNGYLTVNERAELDWEVRAGNRPPANVRFSPQTKQEEIFVTINQLLAPDFALWQYRPADGDAYSLFLAPSEWWRSLATEHPKVPEKYFLSAERLAAYWKKSYFARLFSKP